MTEAENDNPPQCLEFFKSISRQKQNKLSPCFPELTFQRAASLRNETLQPMQMSGLWHQESYNQIILNVSRQWKIEEYIKNNPT